MAIPHWLIIVMKCSLHNGLPVKSTAMCVGLAGVWSLSSLSLSQAVGGYRCLAPFFQMKNLAEEVRSHS